MDREDSVKRCGVLLAALALFGCGSSSPELAPYGEVLVQVDTNLRVPQTITRVRFDLFDLDLRWLDSRDFAAPEPSDFPLSFSIYNDSPSAPRSAYLRVRGYTDGRVRDYRGERFEQRPTFDAPKTASSLTEACEGAPVLSVGHTTQVRFRGEAFEDVELGCASSEGEGDKKTQSGLGVFVFPVENPGTYHLSVATSVPGVEWSNVADTVLSLRAACEDARTELACNDDEQIGQSTLSGLTATLEPGTYYVLVGNVAPGPMDVGVFVEQRDAFSNQPTTDPVDLDRELPRLIVGDLDITPVTEPEPELTVDRLARLDVAPGAQSTAKLLLSGECLGTMASLDELKTCVDREGTLIDVTPEPLEAGRGSAEPSAVGSWSKYRRPGCAPVTAPVSPEIYDEQLCVAGGAFLLGDATLIERGADGGYPERLAVIPSLFVDRYEYTVARYRKARERGFEPPDAGPYNNFDELELSSDDLNLACTWNETIDGRVRYPERESLPLSCVSWLTAKALCERDGGRLPTVAEREYLASAAGREFETTYPWGDDAPTCDQAVFGRWYELTRGSTDCLTKQQLGPLPVDAEPWRSFDVTPDGVVGLGGNLAEWTEDSHRAYSDACFLSQPLESPVCDEPEAPLRTIAGGSWRSSPAGTRAASRIGGAVAGYDPWVGFRCVYAVEE